MCARARHAGVRLRPHFKTHQSAAIGEWFREAGVDAITVSSLEMADYFAAAGWDDITVAFPVNLRQIERINTLARQVRLGLLVDHLEPVAYLSEHLRAAVTVWVKIDAGYGRAGVDWRDSSLLMQLMRRIADCDRMQLGGLLTHSGQSYGASSRHDLQSIHDRAMARLIGLRDQIATSVPDACQISIGDTPTCCHVDQLEQANEIRPGNFVFFDLMQLANRICAPENISLALACPVTGKYPARNEIGICGGAIHLSKESLVDPGGNRYWGRLATVGPNGFTAGEFAINGGESDTESAACLVSAVSQEHGIVSMPAALQDQLQIGDLVLVLPVHSCLTAQQHGFYRTLDGQRLTRFHP